MDHLRKNAKRFAVEGLGWLLVVVGIAALVLPGPGLLALFAGVALLATQYEWAERRLEPIQNAALKAAADGVKTWPRIVFSVCAAFAIMAAGIVWGLQPSVPSWWFLSDKLWLIGGWGTGATLIGSSLIALGMIVYSYVHFRETVIK